MQIRMIIQPIKATTRVENLTEEYSNKQNIPSSISCSYITLSPYKSDNSTDVCSR